MPTTAREQRDATGAEELAAQAAGAADVPAPADKPKPKRKKKRVAIEFKHVTKRYKLYRNDRARMLGMFSKRVKYKTICANDDISFKIYRGQSVALLGSNGAGKSTALKIISGVVYPTEGEVTVNGRVSALLELKAGFDPSLTGRENIFLRGQIWGLTREEIEKFEPRVIKFADLGDYIDQPVRTYSSGMKARLGFAFASSIKPDILICDEALAVGDRAFARKCRRRVRRIIRRNRTTVLFVTHSIPAARRFCDYGIVMEQGKVVFQGLIDDAIEFYLGSEEPDENEPEEETDEEFGESESPNTRQEAGAAAGDGVAVEAAAGDGAEGGA